MGAELTEEYSGEPFPHRLKRKYLAFLSKLHLRPKYHANLKRNFERFGLEFKADNISAFAAMARDLYRMAITSDDSLYSIVLLPKHRCGIDYNGEYRGVYEADGYPIAFFRPNFHELGYSTKDQELQAWRSGQNARYYASIY